MEFDRLAAEKETHVKLCWLAVQGQSMNAAHDCLHYNTAACPQASRGSRESGSKGAREPVPAPLAAPGGVCEDSSTELGR